MLLSDPVVLAFSAAGVVGGLVLLARGMAGYQNASRIADTSTSRIGGIALGEVRVTGSVEPAELTLVSPLQSATCVYYRAKVDEQDGRSSRTVMAEERAVGFRVRDATGTVRIFPRGAHFDVPATFHDRTGLAGDEPTGLEPRIGSAIGQAQPSRADQIAALLTVHGGSGDESLFARSMTGGAEAGTTIGRGPGFGSLGLGAVGLGGARRTYDEARIEPGALVTVLGRVLPFDELPDPMGADAANAGSALPSDPEIVADLADARASGLLAPDAAAAWGNAAIPGFGIGRPVTTPSLDPRAQPLAPADAEQRERARRTFDLGPDTLVLAASDDVPLVIALGPPAAAASRQENRFLLGLLGAVLAIGCAVVLATGLSSAL